MLEAWQTPKLNFPESLLSSVDALPNFLLLHDSTECCDILIKAYNCFLGKRSPSPPTKSFVKDRKGVILGWAYLGTYSALLQSAKWFHSNTTPDRLSILY